MASRGDPHGISRWFFLRLLGVTYLIAFVSLWVQLDGLIGSSGILPSADLLRSVESVLGAERFWWLPTLCWLDSSDRFLHVLCGGGTALSLLLVFAVAPVPVLVLLWIAYLSLVSVGQDFLSFQWDILLLETGFLAIFLAPLTSRPGLGGEPATPRPIVLLLRWLLFRLMFSSGAVKLLSGDSTWWNLTALEYHYWTQPLPTWIGWYANLLPDWFQVLSCAVLFAIELGAPCLIAAPQNLRLLAFFLLVFLQLLIFATGNYCFFNVLTVALCLLLLDDEAWPARIRARFANGRSARGRPWPRSVILPVVGVIVVLSLIQVLDLARIVPGSAAALRQLRRAVSPLHLVNGYGLFAVMTTTRPEIVVEASDDGATWSEYEFRWKPGNLSRAPAFVEPHQPRLDWQMWFAALGSYQQSPWFVHFVRRLLEGSPEVLGLLEKESTPTRPPLLVRAVLYRYEFTDLAERRATGNWWRRERVRLYLPAISLESFRRRAETDAERQ